MVGIRSEEFRAAARSTVFRMFRQPVASARVSLGFARKLAGIALGQARYDFPEKDRRFSDPAWQSSWIYRNLLQVYLAFGESLDEWVDAAGFDDIDARKARVITRLIADSMAPTNNLFGNPAAIKRLVDTGGASLFAGLGNLARDIRDNGGMPSMVDKRPFEVGRNLASAARCSS